MTYDEENSNEIMEEVDLNEENSNLIVNIEMGTLNPINDLTTKQEEKGVLVNIEANNYVEYIIRLFIHILLHLTLLSILESIFYFYYVLTMETELLYEELAKVLDIDLIYPKIGHLNEISAGDYIEHGELNDFFAELKEVSNEEKNERNDLKEKLQEKTYHFSIITCSVLVAVTSLYKYFYRRKYILMSIMFEHMFLMICIGAYEYWFFNNIIIKYSPWAENMVLYNFIQCYWLNMVEIYPNINFLYTGNNTMECNI